MKLSTFLYILVHTGIAIAYVVHDGSALQNAALELLKRNVDPVADPTRFSVLSVLETAIPSGALSLLTANPEPTHLPDPTWYENLPEDVKSLLPVLYPKARNEAETTEQLCTTTTISSTTTTTLVVTVEEKEVARSESSETTSTLSDAISTSYHEPKPTANATATMRNATATVNVTATGNLTHTPTATETGSHSAGSKFGLSVNAFSATLVLGIGVGFFVLG